VRVLGKKVAPGLFIGKHMAKQAPIRQGLVFSEADNWRPRDAVLYERLSAAVLAVEPIG